MKVLLIEDKKPLAEAIAEYLRMHKLSVEYFLDGDSGYEAAVNNKYDILVLDLMLPKKDGLSIIHDLKEKGVDLPILVLTAKSSTDDKVSCLYAGADDYVTKPFVLDELLARIYALSRRKKQVVPNVSEFYDIKVDKFNHTLTKDAQTLNLSTKEFLILECLLAEPENVVSKHDLLKRVWGSDNESYYNSVEVYISFLRRKLEALHSIVKVKSFRNLGYKLVVTE